MRIIDRLATYLAYKDITAYSFERTVDVANGYLKKQLKGRGSIGSDILQRVYEYFPDLDFIWLFTGNGEMLRGETEPVVPHFSKDEMIIVLNARISVLEMALADKEKIIAFLERGEEPLV